MKTNKEYVYNNICFLQGLHVMEIPQTFSWAQIGANVIGWLVSFAP